MDDSQGQNFYATQLMREQLEEKDIIFIRYIDDLISEHGTYAMRGYKSVQAFDLSLSDVPIIKRRKLLSLFLQTEDGMDNDVYGVFEDSYIELMIQYGEGKITSSNLIDLNKLYESIYIFCSSKLLDIIYERCTEVWHDTMWNEGRFLKEDSQTGFCYW